ncbi:phytoene/squalene synthase family protein [Lacibacterium aquatile]|uniref:Phytoene/squalene synthase family protein n=1 Tax=Lacibacterium aquatile TaxID=1168082 RepID=A0ABW5DTL6_9PROT
MSDAPHDFCLGELKAHDHPRFLVALLAPSEHRDGLSALFAFNLEIAKTRSVVREAMMGQIRLQWWRDALAEIYEGREVRKHQVVQPLAEAISRYSLPRQRLDKMIDAREADLEPHPPGTQDGFESYVSDTAGELGELTALILGADPLESRAAAEAYGFAGLLVAIPHRAMAGRIDLPLDRIAQSGLTARDIRDGIRQELLPPLIEGLAKLAHDRLSLIRGMTNRRSKAALLPALLAKREVARLEKAGWNPFKVVPSPYFSVLLRMIFGVISGRL